LDGECPLRISGTISGKNASAAANFCGFPVQYYSIVKSFRSI
jgi:hypothetical protein